MKKIFLALMVSLLFAGTGFCAPHHKDNPHRRDEIMPPPPPPAQYNIVRVRRHKHGIPRYDYGYPVRTQVIINTGGFAAGYSVGGYGGSYVTYSGGFQL